MDDGTTRRLVAGLILLSLTTWACGGEEPNDCRGSARACFGPFACAQDADGVFHCTGDHLPAPACMGSPGGIATTLQTTDGAGGPTLHWVLDGGCVPVTYDSSFVRAADRIADAVAQINALSCSRLCFDEPSRSDEPLDIERAERRFHFVGVPPEMTGPPPQAVLFFEVASGRVFGVEAEVSALSAPELPARNLLALMAIGAGISPATTAPSVTSWMPGGPAELTTEDEEGLCHLYSDPSACADDTSP